MDKKIRICITGGHLTPALAVIDEIQRAHPEWEIVFIGRAYSLEQDTQMSQEYEETKKQGIQFFPISAGRLRRDISMSSLFSLVKIPIGFIQSFWHIFRIHPQCIVSFGGYIGFPVALSGWLLGIPVVTHEQTHILGVANRWMLPFVKTYLLSYEDTKYAPAEKSYVTGLPIRRVVTHPSKTLSFAIPPNQPIIYITGGSTGAVSMNELLFPCIHSLVTRAVVIHQTGPRSFEKAVQLKETLPDAYRSRYIPFSYIDGKDVGWIMHHMSLIVGRSGVNTVAETATVGKPAVFIPLPWSGQHEQEQNARWYEKTGMAYVANQKTDTSADIEKNIRRLLGKKQNDMPLGKPDVAATNVMAYIEPLVDNNEK